MVCHYKVVSFKSLKISYRLTAPQNLRKQTELFPDLGFAEEDFVGFSRTKLWHYGPFLN
jgi:hypothetical protein